MWRVSKSGTEFRHAHRCFSLVSNGRSLLSNVHMLGKVSSSEPCTISSMASNATASQPLSVPGQRNPVFIDHAIYKGKVALRMQPIAPEFSPLDCGTIQILKEGAILLKFAPALGHWQYDWKKEQVFRLSATEIGSLLSLSPNESCEFFYNPFMGTSNAGQVTKALQITPIPNSPGYLFELSVSDKSKSFDSQLTIPITKAEFAVMRTAFNFLLPYFVGWHASVNFIQRNQSSHNILEKSGEKKSSVVKSIKPDQPRSIAFGKSEKQTSSTKNTSTSDQDTSIAFGKSKKKTSPSKNSTTSDQDTSTAFGKSKKKTSPSKNSTTFDQDTSTAFGKSKKQASSTKNSSTSDQDTSIAFGKSKKQTSSTKKSSSSDQDTSTAFGKSQTEVSSVMNSVKPDQSASLTLGKSEIQVSSDSEWSR